MESSPRYQTLKAEPHRDTKGASKWNGIGLRAHSKGKLARAEEAFQKALIQDVSFGPAHNNLGRLYFERGDYYLAAWEFEYARKLMPGNPDPVNNLGLVYEAADRLGAAIELYEEAREIAQDDPEYLANLTRAKLKRGDAAPEVAQLLEEVVWRDGRPDWKEWAEELLQTRYKDWHETTRQVGREILGTIPDSEPVLIGPPAADQSGNQERPSDAPGLPPSPATTLPDFSPPTFPETPAEPTTSSDSDQRDRPRQTHQSRPGLPSPQVVNAPHWKPVQ